MHPVENSATIKSLSREFSYTQVTVERVQLQTNYPVESSAKTNQPAERSATNKSPYTQIRDKLETNHHVESSATKNHPVETSARN